MDNLGRFYIDGVWATPQSNQMFPVQNPATEQQAAMEQAVGDPNQEGDHLGPLFDQIQFDRVQALVQIGIAEGARVLSGGTGKPEEIKTLHFG